MRINIFLKYARNGRKFKLHFARQYSLTVSSLKLNEKVLEQVENEEYKPRKHPGIIKTEKSVLPNSLNSAIKAVLADFPVKSVCNESILLTKYLEHRAGPLSEIELKDKQKEVKNTILNQHLDEIEASENAKKIILDKYRSKYKHMLSTKIGNWSAINYNTFTCLQYLIGRAAPEYCVLLRIFTELTKRVEFRPRSFFDFGSGIGTGTWAARHIWGKYLYEYFCVDISSDMNDLADALLKDGFGNAPEKLRGVFHRQFLPASNTQYDLVLSAYSLLELPSSNNRLETILNLWNKTSNFLVLVERGNRTGFKIINEARDFILSLNNGHVFMPCPHDLECPRFVNDHTPCNFEINYQKYELQDGPEFQKERYCYVVLRKGKREDGDNWPRIIRPTLVRSKHVICRLCTNRGTLEEVIVTAAKHGKTAYRCTKASNWGDLLPVDLEFKDKEDIK